MGYSQGAHVEVCRACHGSVMTVCASVMATRMSGRTVVYAPLDSGLKAFPSVCLVAHVVVSLAAAAAATAAAAAVADAVAVAFAFAVAVAVAAAVVRSRVVVYAEVRAELVRFTRPEVVYVAQDDARGQISANTTFESPMTTDDMFVAFQQRCVQPTSCVRLRMPQ